MNISVPDELAEQVRARDLPISAICQDALRKAVDRHHVKENVMSDIAAVVERLRGTIDDAAREKRQEGRADGIRWAKEYSTAAELEEMASYQGGGGDLTDHTLLAFQSDKTNSPDSYFAVRVDVEDPYWEAFIAGAAEVWDVVAERLHWKGPVDRSRDW
ncbi:type II toxin-antitoxin system CcdA family antitoxin [Streptomyces sp. T028]|uniref:type II toxin-antitoxin system CcdA family antitoxin n=1 Tax=Streptomyces sp. T028 TaxID=3394379 RepID=UPI003A842219